MKRRPFALVAVLLLLLAHASLGLAASNRAHRQIAFSDPALAASPTSEPNDERQWHAHANAALVDDDDPAPVAALRLSHAGLYINQAHAPSLIHRPDHDNATHAFQPHPLVVHMDPALYSTASATASIGPVRLRTRDQVMLHCGNDVGGIESCEYDDLHPSLRPAAATHIEFEQADALDCRATPLSVAADGAFFLDQRSCPGWSKYWRAVELARSTSPHELLQSFVVTINVAKLPPASASSQYETHRFWIGQLHLEQSRASWPLAGNARDRRPGQDDRTWHPHDVNRIAGAMENPMIPKSSLFTNDRNYGVYVDQSSWTLGVQIKIPLSITNPRGDDDDDDDDDEGSVHANMMLPPEEVFAPVSGQVVWARDYTFRRPPLFGPAAGLNDEASFCVMVRDEWSIVYQIFGLDAATVGVREGDTVLRGDVLGHALREGLSVEPPSTEPPADHAPSKPDDEVSFYPHRYRTLEVRVARPNPNWSEWKHPDESGWQYFHPLHVFTEGNSYRSSITPYGSPTIIYFSKPSVDPLNTPPNAYATSNDFWTPTLQGPTEIIVGFEYFQQTPGDPADGMENLAIYALDVGIRKKRTGEREAARGMECDLGGDTDPSGTDDKDRAYWRTVFEHAKLPNNWTPSVEGGSEYGWRSKLFSHYMPAFSHGRFFPEKITSQFDDKERRLYYSASRTVRGEPKLGGALNVQSIIERDGDEGGRGKYRLVVRARDYWGNLGCLASDVLLA
ncbi:uncharacterized protein PAN0_015d5101 [Moesziomyces antarcticus]|uniref:Uncharacterized protein n=2 Tax=Pseudozyma antarctica TaxID=84753 RepID=A0A5C3FWH8_PSEA2|nr:uncharacterized protein PAN0_015d5101 [Moesziomyces antarcticus]GAK66877.1 conserved hypothetical protein [Moesziomyces antarcticus]SPO47927.1 uncharacterized protein PSANT_05615 [Moesziomyces antarcticus]